MEKLNETPNLKYETRTFSYRFENPKLSKDNLAEFFYNVANGKVTDYYKSQDPPKY